MLMLHGIENTALPDIDVLRARLPAQWVTAWEEHHGEVSRKKNTLTARQSLGGLYLLNALGAVGTLRYEASGKPRLFDATLDFSITHTDRLVLCALNQRTDGTAPRVGLDAESIKRSKDLPIEKLVVRWFAKSEQAQYQGDASAENFTRIWTRKEALVKYHGEGLSALHASDTVAAEKSGIRFTEYRIGNVLITLCHTEETVPTGISFYTMNI